MGSIIHYDKALRLKQVNTSPTYGEGTVFVTYTYNALGQRTDADYGNGAYTEYTYTDDVRWLKEVANYKSDTPATLVSKFVYEDSNWSDPNDHLDLVGNRCRMDYKIMKTDNQNYLEGHIHYRYDEVYQLITEDRDVTSGSPSYLLQFEYDAAGNRLKQYTGDKADNNYTKYICNAANQLTTEEVYESGVKNDSKTLTYTYDAAGNMTSKTDASNNVYSYGYNSENRMLSYTDPITSANSAEYKYNALGSRVKKTVNPEGTPDVECYVLDGADVIADYDGSGNLEARYVTPMLDSNVMLTRDSVNYLYVADGLGSIRNLLRWSDESVQNVYDYKAFGEAIDWDENVDNRYTYTGREWDSESSTYHYRWRTLIPTLGSFVTRDPVVEEVNLYTYVYNNPANIEDPSGLWANFTRNPQKERGTVCCDKENDTWEKLAKMTNLEENEYHKWVRHEDGKVVGQNEKPKKSKVYTFPNILLVIRGWSKTFKEGGDIYSESEAVVRFYQGAGLCVKNYTKILYWTETLKKSLYGIVFIGHGICKKLANGCKQYTGNIAVLDIEKGTRVRGWDVKPSHVKQRLNHLLARVCIYACGSAAGKWETLVSKNGRWVLFPGKMYGIPGIPGYSGKSKGTPLSGQGQTAPSGRPFIVCGGTKKPSGKPSSNPKP